MAFTEQRGEELGPRSRAGRRGRRRRGSGYRPSGRLGVQDGGPSGDRAGRPESFAFLSTSDRFPCPTLSPADMMFEAIDENADGEISAAEYRQLIEA